MNTPLVALSSDKHRHLRLAASQPYHFVRTLMLCPVVSGEIRQIARDYVIVFPPAAGVPQALLGTEQGVNAYVADSGHWLCRYVPAHVRRHPFYAATTAAADATASRAFTVAIDESAPHLGTEQGEPLFNEDGSPAPTLERVKAVLLSLQRDLEATTRMVAQLDEAGLLAARNLQVRSRDGAERTLTGFRLIDTEKLAKLEAEALAGLHRNGALLLAYAHLISLANLRDGVLVKPLPQAASAATGGFSLGDTDLLDFSRLQ